MQTTDRGSPWQAAAASSPGYLLSCGWSDLALEYAEALQKHMDNINILDTHVVMNQNINMLVKSKTVLLLVTLKKLS